MLPWRVLRYPVVFGSCLMAYFGAFSFRRTYFKSDVEEARDKNISRAQTDHIKLEATQQKVRMELAHDKAQIQK
ncbi:hypothetical protein PoB_007407000 [Plakobranchus ocellatus]|uniref:ATP synthase subunit e, mitochondrial n=1 Tax=Plakobranchus ocellatus TaxID=259542 RepID=A0AAV4DU52_9GAST|nr:hypothetical protein PoB_007407000 [Plakobranchus ocellatus]